MWQSIWFVAASLDRLFVVIWSFFHQLLFILKCQDLVLKVIYWISDIEDVKSPMSNYESHWHILVFSDHWKTTSNLNSPYGKMFDFVSFPLFGFTLVIKMRNFDFECHWNNLTFLIKTNYLRFDMSCQTVSSLSFVAWAQFWQ